MPAFQGMGYPLVPGYECFGKVSSCSEISGLRREILFLSLEQHVMEM